MKISRGTQWNVPYVVSFMTRLSLSTSQLASCFIHPSKFKIVSRPVTHRFTPVFCLSSPTQFPWRCLIFRKCSIQSRKLLSLLEKFLGSNVRPDLPLNARGQLPIQAQSLLVSSPFPLEISHVFRVLTFSGRPEAKLELPERAMADWLVDSSIFIQTDLDVGKLPSPSLQHWVDDPE